MGGGCSTSFPEGHISQKEDISSHSISNSSYSGKSRTVEWKCFPSLLDSRQKFEMDGTLRFGASETELEFRLLLTETHAQKELCSYAASGKGQCFAEFSCWFAIERFKSINTQSFRKSVAQHIIETFVVEGSPLYVRSTDSLREIICEVIGLSLSDDDKPLHPRFFDQLQSLCFEYMHTEIYLPFSSTVEFSVLEKKLENKYNRARVDDFVYLNKLGEGGYGLVVRCQRKTTGKYYAVKIQEKKRLLHSHRKNLNNICLEMEILAQCQHPFIIDLAYAFQTPTLVFMVMSLATSGDLNELLKTVPGKRLDEDLVRFYMAEVVLAIHYLHQQRLIYRDLKPNNIILNEDGHVQLLDMGGVADINADATQRKHPHHPNALVADGVLTGRYFHSTEGTNTAGTSSSSDETENKTETVTKESKEMFDVAPVQYQIVGTLVYMAPEMIVMMAQSKADREGYTKEVDWWSLGVTMFKILTGGRPFKEEVYENMVEMSTMMEQKAIKYSGFSMYARLFQTIDFPDYASESVKDIIRSFLHVNPKKRLGAGANGFKEIKAHQFFKGIDWQLLETMRLKPPSVPTRKPKRQQNGSGGENLDEESPKGFEELLTVHGREHWLVDGPLDSKQDYFQDWNFTSPTTVRIEAGLSGAEAQYRQSVKAKRIIGTLTKNDRGIGQLSTRGKSQSFNSNGSSSTTSLRLSTSSRADKSIQIFDPLKFIAKNTLKEEAVGLPTTVANETKK